MCVLSCRFEPPKPKTKHKHNLGINTREAYEKLYCQEQHYYKEMVEQVNLLVLQNDLPAVRWVGRMEIELLPLLWWTYHASILAKTSSVRVWEYQRTNA